MSHLGRSLRRTPAREHTVLRVAVALAVALALHAGIVLWLARVPWALRAGREAQPVALAPLTAQQWQANRAVGGERAAPAPPPPPAPAPRDERQPKGQFVDLYGAEEPDAAKSKADANARFDSGRDHHAEKETVSRWKGMDRLGHVLDRLSSGEARAKPAPPGEGGDAQRHAEGAPGDRANAGRGKADRVEVPPQQPQQEIALAPGASRDSVASRKAQEGVDTGAAGLSLPGAPAAGGARQAGPLDRRLLPTADTYAHLAGGPRDYGIRDAEEGDVTSLSTRRFKFATFYSQMYASVAGTWNPRVERAMSARDPDHRMFGGKDYETRVDVTLDAEGHLKEARLVQSCGLEFLDREALAAFRDAAPFPNPPRAIVDENGEIRLGTWAFVLQTSRATIYRDQPQRW